MSAIGFGSDVGNRLRLRRRQATSIQMSTNDVDSDVDKRICPLSPASHGSWSLSAPAEDHRGGVHRGHDRVVDDLGSDQRKANHLKPKRSETNVHYIRETTEHPELALLAGLRKALLPHRRLKQVARLPVGGMAVAEDFAQGHLVHLESMETLRIEKSAYVSVNSCSGLFETMLKPYQIHC